MVWNEDILSRQPKPTVYNLNNEFEIAVQVNSYFLEFQTTILLSLRYLYDFLMKKTLKKLKKIISAKKWFHEKGILFFSP